MELRGALPPCTAALPGRTMVRGVADARSKAVEGGRRGADDDERCTAGGQGGGEAVGRGREGRGQRTVVTVAAATLAGCHCNMAHDKQDSLESLASRMPVPGRAGVSSHSPSPAPRLPRSGVGASHSDRGRRPSHGRSRSR